MLREWGAFRRPRPIPEEPDVTDRPTDPDAIAAALAAPFAPEDVKFLPAVVSGSRALAIPYVDARGVMDRLDAVLGAAGWQDDYEPLPGGAVLCRLRVRLGPEWVTKADAGGPSEQPDEGDRAKAAVSDALKRAAVKFGVARYLHRLGGQWADYDPKKREFVRPPALPAAAQPARAAPPAKPRAAAQGMPAKPPATGAELERRLLDYERRLAAEGLCGVGDLLGHVRRAGAVLKLPPAMADWGKEGIAMAVEQVKEFEARRRGKKPAA